MIIVKITILMIVLTAIYKLLYQAYLRQHPEQAALMSMIPSYVAPGGFLFGIMVLVCIVGVIASTVYLLFFY